MRIGLDIFNNSLYVLKQISESYVVVDGLFGDIKTQIVMVCYK